MMQIDSASLLIKILNNLLNRGVLLILTKGFGSLTPSAKSREPSPAAIRAYFILYYKSK